MAQVRVNASAVRLVTEAYPDSNLTPSAWQGEVGGYDAYIFARCDRPVGMNWDSLRFKAVTETRIVVYADNDIHYGGYTKGIRPIWPYESVDVETVTWRTLPWHYESAGMILPGDLPGWGEEITYHTANVEAVCVKNGWNGYVINTTGAYAPYMMVTYREETVGYSISDLTKPAYLCPGAANRITWKLEVPAQTLSPLEVTSAVFRWKESGSSTEHTISSTEPRSVTIPAGTLTAESDILWRIEVTANSGVTSETEWYTASTRDADSAITVSGAAPASGYVSAHKDATFAWGVKSSYLSGVSPVSATFTWRETGTQAEHSVAAVGASVTIPAETFPEASAVQWKVVVVTNVGVEVTGGWYEVSTTEVTSSATAQSPVWVIVTGPTVRFRWQHNISTGTEPTGYDLQKSDDGSTWEALTGTGDYGNLAADVDMTAFTAGERYWRVRTYNTDDMAGSWSQAAKFIYIAEPAAPSVSVERLSPRFLIAWQAADQEAYEIELDGMPIFHGFGSGNRYEAEKLAAYGNHVIKVRVQNRYSMWSPWAEAALPISGQPSGEVMLTAVQTGDLPQVTLSAFTLETAVGFEWLRDGAVIARTESPDYMDNLGAGIYTVRAVLDSTTGNYIESAPAEVALTVPNMAIYDIKNDRWLSLRLSASSSRSVGESAARAATVTHWVGDSRPTAEYGTATDRSVSFECAFLRRSEEIRHFEELINTPVRLVLTDGSGITGVMSGYQRSHTKFYTTFTATITEAII